MQEPNAAFFQHFNDEALFIPVDPNESEAWLANASNSAVVVTDGYFKKDPIISDSGVVDVRNTRLEFQLPTSTAISIGLKIDTTLIVANVKYRVGVTPDYNGHTHAALTRTGRVPS